MSIVSINGLIEHGKDTFAKVCQYEFYRRKFVPGYLKEPIALDKFMEEPPDIATKNLFRYERSGWQIKKFADKLKDITCILLGCTRAQLESQEFKSSTLPSQWDRTKQDVFKWIDKKTGSTMEMLETMPWKYIEDLAIRHGFKYKRTVREFLQELGTDVLRNWIGDIHVNATMNEYKPIRDFRERDTSKYDSYPNWFITDLRFPNEAQATKDREGITIKIVDPRKTVPNNLHESETALATWQFDEVIINDAAIEDLYHKAVTFIDHYKLQ